MVHNDFYRFPLFGYQAFNHRQWKKAYRPPCGRAHWELSVFVFFFLFFSLWAFESAVGGRIRQRINQTYSFSCYIPRVEGRGQGREEGRGAKSEGVIHSCPTASSVRSASPWYQQELLCPDVSGETDAKPDGESSWTWIHLSLSLLITFPPPLHVHPPLLLL